VLRSVQLRLLAASVSVCAILPAALADEAASGAPPAKAGWSVMVGGGGLWSPDYEGSDDREFRALPYLSVRYEDWLSFAVPEGLKVSLFNEKGFRAGVLAGYRFEREAKDNIALAGWGDVDGSAELGGFVEYRAHWLKLSAELRQGLSDDTGLLGSASARYETRVGPARISVGPQLAWGDDDYMQTYFGITPTQAAASTLGYAPYAAAQGVKSYGVGLSIVSPISGPWGIAAIANVNRLTGDAEDSPIVADHGSATQFTAGVFLSYRF
jgi:outer membrane protein